MSATLEFLVVTAQRYKFDNFYLFFVVGWLIIFCVWVIIILFWQRRRRAPKNEQHREYRVSAKERERTRPAMYASLHHYIMTTIYVFLCLGARGQKKKV